MKKLLVVFANIIYTHIQIHRHASDTSTNRKQHIIYSMTEKEYSTTEIKNQTKSK